MNTASIVVTLIVAVFGSTGFWTWLTSRRVKKSSETKLLMGIAYSQIISMCETYLEKGSVTTNEYHELEHYLFQPYAELGGDGTAEKLFSDVSQLAVKDE